MHAFLPAEGGTPVGEKFPFAFFIASISEKSLFLLKYSANYAPKIAFDSMMNHNRTQRGHGGTHTESGIP